MARPMKARVRVYRCIFLALHADKTVNFIFSSSMGSLLSLSYFRKRCRAQQDVQYLGPPETLLLNIWLLTDIDVSRCQGSSYH